MNLRLYQYNNYYNRTIKPFLTFEGMNEYEVFVEYNTNFNPNDGVSTEHIIGGPQLYGGYADYCIIEHDGEIISSWFVIENIRTRGGQYRVVLKRDSIADYYENVMTSPCFVEKGWVSNSDSAIFNSENMSFNQIKKKEVLLKDTTNIPWLVGYYMPNADTPNGLTATLPAVSTSADYTVSKLSDWTYSDKIDQPTRIISNMSMRMSFMTTDAPNKRARVFVQNIGSGNANYWADGTGISDTDYLNYYYTIDTDSFFWGIVPFTSSIDKNVLNKLLSNINDSSTLFDAMRAEFASYYATDNEYATIKSLAGRTIFDEEAGKLYTIEIEETLNKKSPGDKYSPEGEAYNKKASLVSNMGYIMYNIYQNSATSTGGITGDRPTKDYPNDNFRIYATHTSEIVLRLKEASTTSITATINPTAQAQTRTSPYNIFAIPYGTIRFTDGTNTFYSNAETGMRMMNALIKSYSGGGVLIDAQILPYCPVREVRENVAGTSKSLRLDLRSIPTAIWGKMEDSENNPVGVFFHCVSSSVQVDIDYVITIKDYKIQNETEFCRLCSPNWNGMFEFSPAKNRGVEYFTVDMELKPFQPYIHVAPKWNENGLYGTRNNDAIGLICGGDFGLTMTSDNWQTYERQNKNYQNIFDRQIQNLEIQNEYGRLADKIGGLTGAGQGVASTAMMGGMMGGVYGAIGGGMAGGALSAIGGMADYAINEALRSENIDYTKDQFGYQLGNIQALPDTLSRVNSFNPNNKIFPILEFYGCSEEETEALKQKIKYNGMSIGRIGKLRDFVNPAETTYIKGQLIVLDELPEDSHLANDIANEIYKGVRI